MTPLAERLRHFSVVKMMRGKVGCGRSDFGCMRKWNMSHYFLVNSLLNIKKGLQFSPGLLGSCKSLFCSDFFFLPSFTDRPAIYPDMVRPYWIPIDANFIVAGEKQGKWSRPAFRLKPRGHLYASEDNNTPFLSFSSSSPNILSQKAVYCWANGGAGTRERAQGGWMIFHPQTKPQRQLPTNPGAAGEWSAQRGLFWKTRAHGRKRGRDTEK